jgi:hypothetical protein
MEVLATACAAGFKVKVEHKLRADEKRRDVLEAKV